MKKIGFILVIISCCSFAIPAFATSSILGENLGGDVGAISGYVNNILGYIAWAAWLIVVFMIIWMGIKYMMSAANERADLKNAFIRYIIGAVIVALASTIFSGIMQIVQGGFSNTSTSQTQTIGQNGGGNGQSNQSGGGNNQSNNVQTCINVNCGSTNVTRLGTNSQNNKVKYKCNVCNTQFEI